MSFQGGRKNFDSRFGSPVFKTTTVKKRSFSRRHPYILMFTMSALTLTAYFGRFTYMLLQGKPTPEEEEKMRLVNEQVSAQLAWSKPIRNTYAEYKNEKKSSQVD